MLKSLLKKTRDFAITSALFGSAVYLYLYCKCKKNKEQYLQAIQSDTLKDASRLSNDSFGISWGFQADDTIMSRIDSGDLLFIRFDCNECIETGSMLKCHWKTFTFLEEEFHTLACAYRDQTGLYVIYNEFGETIIKNYCELVSLPYIKSLTLQKRSKNLKKTHFNLRKEMNFQQGIPESNQDFLLRVNRLLDGKGTVHRVEDFLSGEQQINIRTETNTTLRSL